MRKVTWRKVMCGFLLPMFAIAATFWARLQWKNEIEPPHLIWWVWSCSLIVTGGLLGVGVYAYWFRGGHRQDSKKKDD